jgi:hypothetical protein
MKPIVPLFGLCAVLLASATLSMALPAAFTRAAVFEATDKAFKEGFGKLSGKKAEQEKLVKAESAQAAAWIYKLSEELLIRPSPDDQKLLDELAAAFTESQKSAFPSKVQAYLSGLTDAQKKIRVDLRKRYDQTLRDFDGNLERKEGFIFMQIAEELEILGSSFDQEGDLYLASECYDLLGQCFDEALRGTSADLKLALGHYEKAIELHEAIELKDTRLDELKQRKTTIVERGADKAEAPAGGGSDASKGSGSTPAPGADEVPPAAGAPRDAGPTVTVALTFEALNSPDQFPRPSYTADEIFSAWNSLSFGKKGSSGVQFALIPDSPLMQRIGADDVRVDVDGDGKADGAADQKLAITGNFTPFKLQLGKAPTQRPWAFFGITGTNKERYQEIGEMNMQPTDEFYNLYIASAASMVGTLDGTPIRLIDDTTDGQYGSVPQTFGYPGISKGRFQPDFDSIVIGGAKRARPFSEYQEVGGKWYKFEMASTGPNIKASPVTLDTGILKLDYKGPVQPTWLIVVGADDLKNSYFDLVEGGAKGVNVPVGRYTLSMGIITKGKKREIQKCVILPPASGAENYDVAKGKTTLVTLGAPYGFDFKSNYGDGKLEVEGASVVITGSKGERYERHWRTIPRPEVSYRKKGAKKALKSERMAYFADANELGIKGWDAAWFPLDFTMDAKDGGDAVEVQLIEKKHDFFGKIESAWKE